MTLASTDDFGLLDIYIYRERERKKLFRSSVPSGGTQGCEERFLRRFLLRLGLMLLQLLHVEPELLPRSAKGLHGAQHVDRQGWRTAIKTLYPHHFLMKRSDEKTNFRKWMNIYLSTWRRAKAAQDLSMEEGFRSMATNLPISAPLRSIQMKIRQRQKS